jgi:glycosyltransferase involved in cell wall biosynthesis
LTSTWQPDAAIIYNSYLFETIAARWLVKNFKTRLWFEVEDLPLARKREYLNIKPILDSFCWKWVIENATVYSAVNSSILDLLPSDRRRELLPGVVSQKLIENAGRRVPPFRGNVPRTVGYFGGLSRGKGVTVLLEAVAGLPREWKLVVAGAGDLADSFATLARRSPDRIEFAGRLTPEESAMRMCQCDALVIPRENITWAGKGVYPFKTFEYIASGAHIISAPLPQVAGCDTSFFQRWDGVTAGDMIQKLIIAPADFAKESWARDTLKAQVLNLCSETAVARLATDMINQLTS